MIPFDQVWEITKNISTEDAFHKEECKALYDIAVSLPWQSTIVEIGCEYGRSSSVLAQVSKGEGHSLICIDPFQNRSIASAWMRAIQPLGGHVTLHMMKSSQAPTYEYDLILVDGDHRRRNVADDCSIHVTKARAGAYACFHDYGPSSLPEVYPTVQKFMNKQNYLRELAEIELRWREIPTVGCLGIWRLGRDRDMGDRYRD